MLAPMNALALGVYRLATTALAPLAARRLARAATDPAMRARQPERHGRVPSAAGELWLHAASVGEVNAAEGLIRALLRTGRDCRILVTTLTASGAGEVERRFADEPRVRHLFAPLDTPGRVRRWLERRRPARLILVETEIWPELLAQCRALGVPAAMVSARLSPHAAARYRRWRGLFAPALAGLDRVCCQTRAERDRFAALGVAGDRLAVTGNLKLDPPRRAPIPDIVAKWRTGWADRPTWLAGSTHAGEEPILAATHRRVRDKVDNALLICVPRHPERAAGTLATLERAGIAAVPVARLRTSPDAAALVVDRIGVLPGLYRVVDAAVVCGSLVPGIGGHNLFEPALAGKSVITGPWTESQREARDGLQAAGGLIEVADAGALADVMIGLLSEPASARETGRRARAWAESHRGVVEATLGELAGWLEMESGL